MGSKTIPFRLIGPTDSRALALDILGDRRCVYVGFTARSSDIQVVDYARWQVPDDFDATDVEQLRKEAGAIFAAFSSGSGDAAGCIVEFFGAGSPAATKFVCSRMHGYEVRAI